MGKAVVGVLAALLVGAGITAAGWLIGDGFRAGRSAERIVTVKGLAEREAKADLALWPMRFVATSDQLATAQAELARAEAAVLDFLTTGGIERQSIEVQGIEVIDRLAQAYQSGPIESRFIINENLMVRSTDVDVIKTLSQDVGRLVEAGVVLSNEGFRGPFYLFTGLNAIKPEMIAEATANARAGAEQFAADSMSQVAGIQRANQGLFQILPRDQAPGQSEELQLMKTIRVVTTIDYRLAD